MSAVTEIESAIKKLSVAEQRIIALHLGERLDEVDHTEVRDAADEGIRFLPPHLFSQAPRPTSGRKPGRRTAALR